MLLVVKTKNQSKETKYVQVGIHVMLTLSRQYYEIDQNSSNVFELIIYKMESLISWFSYAHDL